MYSFWFSCLVFSIVSCKFCRIFFLIQGLQSICSVTQVCSFTPALLILIWLCFEKIEKKNFSSNPCFEQNPRCSKLFALNQLDCKSTSQQLATHYCTRLKGLKERIALGSVGVFSFLNVILNDFSLLYCLNFNL